MRSAVWVFLILLLSPGLAFADYPGEVRAMEVERAELAQRYKAGDAKLAELRTELEARVLELAKLWMGTAWGLGAPQAKMPGDGKINCGMFVATVLGDAGIRVKRTKLQRQPAELIIKSFAERRDIARFRNAKMDTFLAGVRQMGDGVYIIGLDFHVGLLHVEGESVRFIHASYVTHTVVDEDAATAEPIVTSKYRVVGKLFSDRMTQRWAAGKTFPVKGNW